MASAVRNLTLLRLASSLLTCSCARLSAARMATAPDRIVESHLQRLYASRTPPRLVVEASGAGGQLFQWVLSVPGASSVFVSGGLPYATVCTDELVGRRLEQYCSAQTASEMAFAAYKKCANAVMQEHRCFQRLAGGDVVGLGITASIASTQPKRGDHRGFVGLHTISHRKCVGVRMVKGARTRAEEDTLVSRLGLATVLHNGVPDASDDVVRPHLIRAAESEGPASSTRNAGSGGSGSGSSEHIETFDDGRHDYISAVLDKRLPQLVLVGVADESPHHTVATPSRFAAFPELKLPAGSVVLSGSFNPLHDGHVGMVSAALKQQGWDGQSPHPPVVFEIAIVNADKPPLSREEVETRVEQFHPSNPIFERHGLRNFAVALTSEPYFVDKAPLFRECTFVIGADTFKRLINPKYYGGRPEDMMSALSAMHHNHCRFVVAGRASDTEFETYESIMAQQTVYLPASIAGLFEALPEAHFRLDISSTELRARRRSESSERGPASGKS